MDDPGALVALTMREIRAAAMKRRAREDDPGGEASLSFEVRLLAVMDDLPVEPRLLRQLFHPSHDWNLPTDGSLSTSGAPPGLLARLLAPLVRLYMDHPLRRQAQLNVYLATLLRRSFRETTRLQLELHALRRRVP